MQEELLVCKYVGSFINGETLFADDNESNFSPSEVLMSSGYQHDVLALKSPVITDKNDLICSMLLKSLSVLLRNKSNSLLFWLEERYFTDTITLLLLKFISKSNAS